MTLGESAGRTGRNTVRPTARRRMSEAERAQHTHLKDDPQEWPDPEINTVGKVAGRMIGLAMMLLIGAVAFKTGMAAETVYGEAAALLIVMLAGHGAGKALHWEMTRRL